MDCKEAAESDWGAAGLHRKSAETVCAVYAAGAKSKATVLAFEADSGDSTGLCPAEGDVR